MEFQPLSAKVGEVKFRKKLVKQHLRNEGLVPEEPGKKEILKILKQRVISTRKILKKLKAKGFSLSPFLEIGAEKGQRSMILVNEFNASGFASDLSFESLVSAYQFAKILGFKKLPNLVCCDAYRLPFANNSFPFVFCFETLHHFPDPSPIVKEIYRVLTPGGIFYFGEEPIKQAFNLGLWRRGYYLNPFEKFLKLIGILPFVSKIGKAEVNHGILEQEFSLFIWKKALAIFERLELTITPVFFGPQSFIIKDQDGWRDSSSLTRILIALQGGGIEGYGIKKEKSTVTRGVKLTHPGGGSSRHLGLTEENLICPDCKKKVVKKAKNFFCPDCYRQFSQKKDVFMFLPLKLHKKIYG